MQHIVKKKIQKTLLNIAFEHVIEPHVFLLLRLLVTNWNKSLSKRTSVQSRHRDLFMEISKLREAHSLAASCSAIEKI